MVFSDNVSSMYYSVCIVGFPCFDGTGSFEHKVESEDV